MRLEPINIKYDNERITDATFKFRQTNIEEVINVVRNINNHSTSPDGIPVKLYELLIRKIAPVLVNIINHSFSTGEFPDILKNITITPIPKINCPLEEKDFRPVCRADFLVKIISPICNKQL